MGARLLNTDGSLQDSCVQAFPTILNQVLDSEFLRSRFPNWKLWGTQALHNSQTTAAEVDAISGACFMVRRSAFESAGQFTPSYFMYSDDIDLSYKIRQAGYSVVCLTGCEVVHHGGRSSARQSSQFVAVAQRESMARFLRNSRGRFYSAAYRCAMSLTALLRLGAAVCLLPLALRDHGKLQSTSILAKWFAVLAWSVGSRSALRVARGQTNA